MKITGQSPFRFGFSLAELMIVIAVLGIFVTIGVFTFSGSHESANRAKLQADLSAVNSAVKMYIASNGDLSEAKDPASVIGKLKSVASDKTAMTLNGFRGGFLDFRIKPVMQSDEEAATGATRVHWDADALKFVFANSGPPGIKKFRIDEDADAEVQSEDRESTMDLAREDTWIWDYEEKSITLPGPATFIPVTVVSTPSTPPTLTDPGTPPPPVTTITTLSPPLFSIPSGSYPFTSFDLSVALIDPNPPGTAKTYYSVNFGPWDEYFGGVIPATPTSIIRSQAVPLNPAEYDSSSVAEETYDASPVQLAPPLIVPDSESFGLFYQNDITVLLAESNPPGNAMTQYRVNGDSWQNYTNPFLLLRTNFPNGALIEARSISTGSPYFLPSTVSLKTLALESLSLAGTTIGSFHDPTGSENLVTNLTPGVSSSHFGWGEGNGRGRSQSYADFNGSSFNSISEGVRFSVGSLNYYNGTISSGTGADTVDLDISLSLDINGNIFNPYFDYTLDLINTPNSNDPWPSADYVLMSDAIASRTIVINDHEFEFRLEFGETTTDGFSLFDEFHVLENKDASVNLYGTLVSLGPISFSGGDLIFGDIKVADDIGTGTVDDPIFQRENYSDPKESAVELYEIAKKAREDAKDARDVAKTGSEDAETAAQDIAAKLADLKYSDAAILAAEAAAGAAAALDAAQTAENAAVIARSAAQTAASIGSEYPDAEKAAIESAKLATEAEAFALEARMFADAAVADAAIVAPLWDDFLTNGPGDDPEGFVQYLADASAISNGTAKSSRDDAEGFSDDAIRGPKDVAAKIDDGKYDEAAEIAAATSFAAIAAEAAALAAEEAAAAAIAAAAQAADIAASNPTADKTASDAQKEADEAVGFAEEARTAADAAAVAAEEVAALMAAIG